jgi:outer membrane protein TolC
VGTEVGERFDFDRDIWAVGVALELPLWKTATKAAVRQAELQIRRIDREYEALERSVLLECRLAARYAKTSAERVKATAKALALQGRKLELEQVKLAQGRSTTRFVIEYQDDLEFAQLAAVDAVARFEKDLAQYRLVQGILLETIGLDEAGLAEDLP